MQVNAILKATATNGKTINTTISYLRQSQKSKATALGTALNQLTTNTFESVQVNEMNVTEKATPTLTIGNWNFGSNYAYAQITYNGDGQLFVNSTAAANIDQTKRLLVQSTNATGTIYATEGNNYAASSLNFTVTQP